MIDQGDYIVRGLKAWREKRLAEIQDEQNELAERMSIDETALDYAFKNPGFIGQDIIEGSEARLVEDSREWNVLERKREWFTSQDTRTADGLAKLLIGFERELKRRCEGENLRGEIGMTRYANRTATA